MHLRTLVTLVGVAICAAPAVAEKWDDGIDYAHPGFYVEAAGLGMLSSLPESVSVQPVGGGVLVNGGYKFNRWYAIHSEFNWGTMSADSSSVDENVRVMSTAKTTSWSVMGVGKVYVMGGTRERFQPYAKLGFGYTGVETSSDQTIELINTGQTFDNPNSSNLNGFAMKFGGGFDYHITQPIYVFVDYTFNLGISDQISGFNFHGIGAGVGFRF